MNLYIELDNQLSGKLKKAYRKDWNYSRNQGSYKTHSDFFSVHWEVRAHSPNKVRLHVESPERKVDCELNFLKLKVIIGVFSQIDKIVKLINYGDFKIGSKLFSADDNKSTEVFHVELDNNNSEEKESKKIEIVDNDIGHIVDLVLKKFEKDILGLGLKASF